MDAWDLLMGLTYCVARDNSLLSIVRCLGLDWPMGLAGTSYKGSLHTEMAKGSGGTMINAGKVFIWIELGLFVLLGLVLPLAVCIFLFPGDLPSKVLWIAVAGIPYFAALESMPYAVWFWLSFAAAAVLLKLLIMEDEERITTGGMILAGLGVIVVFFVLYILVVFTFMALYSFDAYGWASLADNMSKTLGFQ